MPRTALLAGATGLVGQQLLPLLLEAPEYTQVRVLTRRALSQSHRKLQTVQTDFSNLPALGTALQADDVYCCLGTTLRKAGSRGAFEQVDYDYVLALARAALAQGAQQFLVISAAGASAASAAFYSRVKARMEQEVSTLGFTATHILRPSLLLGERAESRPGERLGQLLSPLLSPLLTGPLKRYRPIEGRELAAAMLSLARRQQHGCHIHHLPLSALG